MQSNISIRIIRRPSAGFRDILNNRIKKDCFAKDDISCVGLIQGPVNALIAASDVAQKAASVDVIEIPGLCPSHFTLLAVYGDTSSVETALCSIKNNLKETEFVS